MVPRLHFAHLPTPVEPASRLADSLGLHYLYIKRDDQTGLALGGNKARKLEFLVAEAQRVNARTLLTTGALQSNHCRQTAAAAAKFGLNCILVLVGDQPAKASGNLLLDHLLGANIVWVNNIEEREMVVQETFELAKKNGGQPYLVPYGGSSPTGVLGYAYALKELMDQDVNPDWIIFATSSGGTQAGLVLGARWWGFKGRILGISVDQPASGFSSRIADLATQASRLIGEDWNFSSEEVLINDEYCFPGYGVLTQVEKDAIRLFAQTEGVLLDPVYTGRAAAGLVDLAGKGFFLKDDRIVFWHTGGQPALFAEKYSQLVE